MGSRIRKVDGEKLLLVASILIVDNVFAVSGVQVCFSCIEYLECGTIRTLNIDLKLVEVFDFERVNFAC